MSTSQVLILLSLVVIANISPVIVRLLLGTRCKTRIDGGLEFFDRRPLLGPSKTIRGVLGSVLLTATLAPLFGLSMAAGAGFACLAMLGDTCSSFVKRRLGIAPSRSAPLLDQVPESLLPLWVMQSKLGGSTAEILLATAIFTLVDLLLSRLPKPDQTH